MTSDVSEKLRGRVFRTAVLVAAIVIAFGYGALAYRNSLPPVPQIRAILETASRLSDNDLLNNPRRHHLQPSRGQGDGVTVNSGRHDDEHVLMAGFFDEENQVRLIASDGSVVRKWSLDYFEHFPDADSRACDLANPLRADTHGLHLTQRGEVVFNYEYCGSVKIDQCGKVLWTIPGKTHHSIEPAEAGGYWILGRLEWLADDQPDRFPPFSTPSMGQTIEEDTIMKVTEDGEVVEEFSIPELMRDAGLGALLTANGASFSSQRVSRTQLVHANKVAELPKEIAAAYPLFEAGDLAVSLRGLNLIMVVDPVTRTVKWHRTGPWLRQHDPAFGPDGRIWVFNNNVYRTAYKDEQVDLSVPFTTNIMAVDPESRETEVIFGERPGQEMLSVIRGQLELLDGGRLLITEFDAGRVLEVDADGSVTWEYVNRYDDDFVAEITNASVYPADYVQGGWKACAR